MMTHRIVGENPVDIHLDLSPKMRTTYSGHRTDAALFGGVIGLTESDPDIRRAIDLAHERGVKTSVGFLESGKYPENTALLTVKCENGETVKVLGTSVGGGSIAISEVDGVKMNVNSYGVTIVEKEAFVEGEENGLIRIVCDGEAYFVKYLLVCTGSDTVIPPIPGLAEVDYWTSKEALEIKELPKTLVIIGGGVIGMEFASFFNSMGVKVHIVEMMPEILGVMDKETSGMLRTEYTKRGVSFYLDTKVVEVKPDRVVIEKGGKASAIETDKILLSVGRKANLSNVGLEQLNIELHRNGVKVDEHLLTTHPRVYACGDITGYSLLAHTAIREAEVAINHILGVEDRMNYDCVPGIVYTNPEMAGVGKTEEELIKLGLPYRVTKLPMAYSGRFVAENEQGNGLCKLIQDEEGKIIGCHMLGNPASELIVIAGIAIQRGYTLEEFQKTVFPHPTVGEIYHEVMF